MAEIRRLTDSCLLLSTDEGVSLFDPGFHTFESGQVDLDAIGDVTRVFITHEHRDHVDPGFVRWLVDRGTDLTVYSNDAVVALLAETGIEASSAVPEGVSAEDVLHGALPDGATPPNRAFTVDGTITHPGDSREPTMSAPVLALPLLVPWDSVRGAVELALRLQPKQVVPIHDFYMTTGARAWIRGLAGGVLAGHGIELVDIDWGQSFSV